MTVTTIKSITLADGVSFELTYADLLRPLSDEEFESLTSDVRKNGIVYPIIIGDDGRVIDGQHRLMVAKLLGLTSEQVPQQFQIVEAGATDDELALQERELALTLNLHRRHLDAATRLEYVAMLKSEGLSNRKIAGRIGVDEKTVRRDLGKCSGAAFAAPEHSGAGGGNSLDGAPENDIASRRERVKEAKSEGKSHRAIAKDLGVSVGTVASDLAATEPAAEPMDIEEPRCEVDEKSARAENSSTSQDEADEWEERHRDRIERHTSETEKVVPAPEETYIDVDDSDQPKIDPENFELAVKRQKPGLWYVNEEVSGQVVAVIEGSPPTSHIKNHLVAHAKIPDETGKLHQISLTSSYSEHFDTLKSIRERIEKALSSPEDFWKCHKPTVIHEERTDHDEDGSFHLMSAPKGMERFNDIPLEEGAYKKFTPKLETSSLWLFKSRAKGEDRDGSYHGNCIPQVPEQLMARYTKLGDVVMDCFAGSCTTMVEAQRMGRHFIGIELDTKRRKRFEEVQEFNKKFTVSKMFWDDSVAAFVYKDITDHLRQVHQREDVDHVFLHPPYWDCVKFKGDRATSDLSKVGSLSEFLKRFKLVAWRASKLLKIGRFMSLTIGDISKKGNWVPLAAYCMSQVMELGNLRLICRNVKNIEGNERPNKGLQEYRAVRNGTSTFAFEEVLVFQKVGE